MSDKYYYHVSSEYKEVKGKKGKVNEKKYLVRVCRTKEPVHHLEVEKIIKGIVGKTYSRLEALSDAANEGWLGMGWHSYYAYQFKHFVAVDMTSITEVIEYAMKHWPQHKVLQTLAQQI